MKKKGLYGVNSGNTWHLGDLRKKILQHARHQCCITKKFHSTTHEMAVNDEAKRAALQHLDGVINDGGLREGFVEAGRWRTSNYEITYSVNKRRRWILPELIKDGIDCLRERKTSGLTENIRLVLVERELARFGNGCGVCFSPKITPNDCTGYHDSAIAEPHVHGTRRYSYKSDLRHKGLKRDREEYDKSERVKRLRQRKAKTHCHNRGVQRRQIQVRAMDADERADNDILRWVFEAHRERANDGDPQLPEVRYEVCHPQPLMAHKGYFHLNKWMPWALWKREKGKAQCKTKTRRNEREAEFRAAACCGIDVYTSCLQQSTADTEEVLLDIAIENQFEDDGDTYHSAFKLEDFICRTNDIHATSANSQRLKKKLRRERRTQEKSRLRHEWHHYITQAAAAREEGNRTTIDIVEGEKLNNEVDDIESKNASAMLSDFVIVPRPENIVSCTFVDHCLSPDYLQSSFGEKYTEARSFPRKCDLEFSDYLLDVINGCHPSSERYEKKCELHLMIGELETDSQAQTISSCVRVEGPTSDSDREILSDWLSTFAAKNHDTNITVCDLVAKITYFIATECDMWRRLTTRMQNGKQHPWLRTIPQLQKWEGQSFDVELAYHLLLVEEELGRTSNMTHRDVITVDDCCDICYDGLFTTDGAPQGTALSQCLHWFCNSCWRRHLAERIRRGDVAVRCPGHDCDVLVDEITLMSLLDSGWYAKYLHHSHNAKLERHIQWTWCPNATCGRALKIKSDTERLSQDPPAISVQCQCGTTWCFACHEEPHWPVSCSQARAFLKLARQRSQDVAKNEAGLIHFVQVKRCPKCRHPIEKNGGCQHMMCSRCQCSFCWECLGPWVDHGMTLTCPKSRVAETTMEISLAKKLRFREEYLERAIEMRESRRNSTIARLTKAATMSACKVFRKEARAVTKYHGSHRKKSSWELKVGLLDANDPTILELLNQVATFKLEAMYLLEQAFVVLSNCSRRTHSVTLRKDTEDFLLLLTRLDGSTENANGATSGDYKQRLVGYLGAGKRRMKTIAQRSVALQR